VSESATSSVTISEGVLRASEGGTITLAKPGTDYALELVVGEAPSARLGEKIRGEIRVNAARMDVIETGGKYIEPVAGPPRRVAGRIVEIDSRVNLVVVDAGPFNVVCTPHELQKATRFQVDQMVTMGVKPGATFKSI